jgi:hypothetical protein
MESDTLRGLIAITFTIWALWYFTQPVDRNDGK